MVVAFLFRAGGYGWVARLVGCVIVFGWPGCIWDLWWVSVGLVVLVVGIGYAMRLDLVLRVWCFVDLDL